MKRTILFTAIVSVLSIGAYANTVVTSQTYVDNQDALKQDKITAGTMGSVVTYNGTQNGQAQFSERGIFDDWDVGIEENHLEDNLVTAGVLLDATDEIWDEMPQLPTGTANTVVMYNNDGEIGGERAIYDGAEDYDETTDANKLITAGAVNSMAPELPTGNPGYAVLYDENGDIGGERGIDDGGCWWDEGCAMYNDSNDLVALGAIRDNLAWDLSYDSFYGDDALPTAHAVRRFAQERIPAGTTGSVVVYNGIGGSTGYGDGSQTKFTEKAIANAPIITNGTLTNGNDIASINAVQTKQNKMTCTRWIDNAAHTDANCLLWNMAN